MALNLELLKILDEEDEPLAKRLKIANNAFKSPDLPIQHRETILLKWIIKNTKHKEVWNLLHMWFSSEQFNELNRNDISQEDIKNLTQTLSKRLKHAKNEDYETKTLIIDCILKLIENRLFQQYFRYNLEEYCKFIANVTDKINDEKLFMKFIKNEQLFPKTLVANENFHKYFVEYNLKCFSFALCNINDGSVLFDELCKILQKCIFQKNYKNFQEYFKQYFEIIEVKEKHSVPKVLLKRLHIFYNLENNHAKYTYKLIFQAFIKSYNTDFDMMYKFLIFISESLGFNVSERFKLQKKLKFKNEASLKKSLMILSGLFDVLAKTKTEADYKLSDITFTEFIQNILKSIIPLTQRSELVYFEIIESVIKINPLIIETMINDIVNFMFFVTPYKKEYENLWIAIFEVFSKLHRIQKLISKIIRTLKLTLEKTYEYEKNGYVFAGINEYNEEMKKNTEINILPESVLKYFSHCVTSLASWQVMNLFKTLLFHLDETVKENLSGTETDDSKLLYVEQISNLICSFLSSIQIIEHTTPKVIVDKFVKCSKELEEVLHNFGNSLLNKKYNHTLMLAYLNICYTWGELYMSLSYYSINEEISVARILDCDYSACNIRYLHSYLSTEQWCLISQRVTNFGLRDCQHVMQKLFIQKIRAMLIFEKQINNDILMSVVRSITSNLENNWECIVTEFFSIKYILPKIDNKHLIIISEYLLEQIKQNKLEIAKQPQMFDNPLLINSLLYVTLIKINKLLKQKQSVHETEKILSIKVIDMIDEKTFINAPEAVKNLNDVIKTIEKGIQPSSYFKNKIDEVKLNQLFDILKKLPIVFCKPEIKTICFCYLFSVFIDLNCNKLIGNEIKINCENLLIGMLQSNSEHIIKYFNIKTLIQAFTNYFTKYKEAFNYLMESMFKYEELISRFKPGIVFLSQQQSEVKVFQISLCVLNSINKLKKSKINEEDKALLLEYKNQLCDSIVNFINESEVCETSLEAYAIVLKIILSKTAEKNLPKLLPHLNNYVEIALKTFPNSSNENTIKGSLILFTTVLRNKAQLEIESDFVSKVWSVCKNLKVNYDNLEELSELLVIIFEHIPNEKFEEVCKDLFASTKAFLDKENYELLQQHLKIWNICLSCNFNPVKTKTWQEILCLLLREIIITIPKSKNNKNIVLFEDITKFEVNIIKTSQLNISSSLLDVFFLTISILFNMQLENFINTFTLSIDILENVLKYRRALIMDKLPSFLQQYRTLLKVLCVKSNSNFNLNINEIQELSNCSHKLEKLTNSLVACNKHVARISPYLIADILKQYEQVTLYPAVKIHLNNCLYSLMTLCDQHAVSFLMRVLSPASTELFKVLYENYKKFYKFTGKV